MERWLHQHIFKVGWLLTRNFETTTILYYTFFLPGVIIHEVILWLVAGMLNVRADQSIQWPQKQEIGELKLNFVRISNRATPLRRAAIATAPLIIGLLIIGHAANNILQVGDALSIMSTGSLSDVEAGLRQLTSAPDFWLWIYLIFTIGNTMYPAQPKDLQGWRNIIYGIVAVIIAIIILGVAGDVATSISEPFGLFLSGIQNIFVILIAINFFMVLALGLVEYTVEQITGNTATFRRGKMITMTRAEAQEQRRKDEESARRRKQQRLKQLEETRTGPPSIYVLTLDTPDAPGIEPVTPLVANVVKPSVTDSEADALTPRRSVDAIEGESQPLSLEKPASSTELVDKEQPKPSDIRFNIPSSITDTDDDDSTDSTAKPKSPITPPDTQANLYGNADKVSASITKPTDSGDSDDETEDKSSSKPSSSFGGFRSTSSPKPPSFSTKPTDSDDSDDEAEDKSPPKSSSSFSGFRSTSSPKSPSFGANPSDSDDSDDETEDKSPSNPSSTFGGFRSTSSSKSPSSGLSGFRPAPKPSSTPKDDESSDDEKRSTLRGAFGGLGDLKDDDFDYEDVDDDLYEDDDFSDYDDEFEDFYDDD